MPALGSGGARGELVEPLVLRHLAQKGFKCEISSVYFKRGNNTKAAYQLKRSHGTAQVTTFFDDNRLYLVVPKSLQAYAGFFEFDLKRLKALSKDFLYTSFYESGITRKLEIKFTTGVGYFDVDASYGGFLNNPKTSIKQKVLLENCRLL